MHKSMQGVRPSGLTPLSTVSRVQQMIRKISFVWIDIAVGEVPRLQHLGWKNRLAK